MGEKRVAGEKPIILVVDDEPVAIKMVTLQLADLYHVVAAANGEQALAAIAQQHPDLIILDVVMPGLDGFEVCRKLKYEQETTLNLADSPEGTISLA